MIPDTRTLRVGLGDRSYDITIGSSLVARIGSVTEVAGQSVYVLTDEHVADPHGIAVCDALRSAGARSVEMLGLPPGEKTKCFTCLEQVLSWLLENKAGRKSILFTVGGGVIGDLGGFAASIMMRGMKFVQIPTSLLAQVDSSVGGKTGINTAQGKNLVGSFYQPQAVLCDLDILRTLPRREILAGYAEIVKYGLLGDAGFFDWLEQEGRAACALDMERLAHAIEISCRMKADIVAKDERELNDMRALLNLGHTFGHALESIARFDGRLLHGEAVAIGTVLAFRLSVRRGHCPAGALERVIGHFRAVGLPTSIRDITPRLECDAATIMTAMEHDKKAEAGQLVFVLVNDIGRAFVARDVEHDDVRAVIEESLQD